MNWFERHLNWSLLFVDILLPFIVGMIWVIVFFSILGGLMMSMQGVEKSPEFIGTLFSSFLPVALISVLVSIGITIFQIVTTLWYLGKKGRSKGLIILIIVPWVFTFILAFFNAARIGEILGGLGYIAGVIILLLLENQSVGYDADFVRELEADRWQDTGQFGMSDDRQYKELDYRYVEDASDVSPAGGEIPAPPPQKSRKRPWIKFL